MASTGTIPKCSLEGVYNVPIHTNIPTKKTHRELISSASSVCVCVCVCVFKMFEVEVEVERKREIER